MNDYSLIHQSRSVPYLIRLLAHVASTTPVLRSVSTRIEIEHKSFCQFVPRDARRKRALCCRSVFVRPSVMFVYCIAVYLGNGTR